MRDKDIVFRDVVALRGPNIWTYRPVLEAWVDIGALEDYPSNTIAGLYERLSSWLPGLIEHRCSPGVRGGFLQRLREGTWPGHILEHVTLELQTLAGLPGGFGKARETSERGVYKVVVRAWEEHVARAALEHGRELVLAAIQDRPYDVERAVARLREVADTHCLGPSTACIVDAADDRDIPCIRLFEGNLVQLGYGSRQRRIWTAETDSTSAIAEGISRDKELTKALLSDCGVPVPQGRDVDSPADAWQAAQDIGLPVVVKPRDGNHGRGVFTNLATQAEVLAAYEVAVQEGSGVLVERFVPGNEHRLLVVGDRMVAAAAGEPAWITGDGRHTVQQLVDLQINSDPRRGRTENHPLNVVRLDSAARLELTRQGLQADSIPADGRRVLIQRNGNVAFDVTDRVHPDTVADVVLAARVVGLDVAGVDLVAEDISQPLAAQAGAIVEVNAGPGLLMHLRPADGPPRPVGRAIVHHLFPEGDDGRIPAVGITGTNGKTVVARLLARLLALSGRHTGLACSEGLYLGARLVQGGDQANWAGGRRLLVNRSVDAAVIENDSGVILGQGLPYDRCQVGVVTNIGQGDHLGDYDIQDTERLANAFRTQVDVVLPGGVAVLNAQDPAVAEMAPLCDGEVIFFGRDPALPAIAAQLAQGRRAVFLRAGAIVLAAGSHEAALADIASVPLTHGARVAFQVENVLAAVAAAWALDVPEAIIRAGIEAFDSEQADAPWQFTLFERGGATVVVDAAHNASALRALLDAVAQFPAARRHAVYAAGADRRDAELIEQGGLLAGAFDRIVLYDDVTVASRRAPGQARALLRQGIGQHGRRPQVHDEPDHASAIDTVLGHIRPGDFVLLQSDEANSGPTIDRVRRWIQQQ
ncbi:cyanophycin synthetase [Bordetella genomosp. 7]|uniref:Cyanophycin synthetase n=1 Tax=Bordetella genomosp. 7 TaxID=1416805 RepID=A0A261RIY4_9BORD|nr:cyanophycin synthetase [Bordetella genomosp. 7]OZI24915.1 cyanophycin synthetase [Bordetella genomosp. 7]